MCFRNGHGSKYGVQKLGYGRKKGVQKVVTEGKKGSKTWLRKQKWISNMVTETNMDLKYGHGNKMRFQIWSRKYHIVGSLHLTFQHQQDGAGFSKRSNDQLRRKTHKSTSIFLFTFHRERKSRKFAKLKATTSKTSSSSANSLPTQTAMAS